MASSITGVTGYTDSGTAIRKPGSELDKNAFLKILATELSHMDPTQQTDSTQYIAQMAQFSTIEQLGNLNDTLTYQGATSLVGKYGILDIADKNGNPYCGIVKNIAKTSSGIYADIAVNEDGKDTIKTVPYSDIIGISQDGKITKDTPSDAADNKNNTDSNSKSDTQGK